LTVVSIETEIIQIYDFFSLILNLTKEIFNSLAPTGSSVRNNISVKIIHRTTGTAVFPILAIDTLGRTKKCLPVHDLPSVWIIEYGLDIVPFYMAEAEKLRVREFAAAEELS